MLLSQLSVVLDLLENDRAHTCADNGLWLSTGIKPGPHARLAELSAVLSV